MTQWHYAVNGEQIGPVSIDDIKVAVNAGKITTSTKVWNGKGDWKPAKETRLFDILKSADPAIPPPLASEDVANNFIWILIVVPILGVTIDFIIGTVLIFPSFIANTILCIMDIRKLKAAGYIAPNHWTVFIVPVYIWKRATLLNHKRNYFYSWIASFFLSIFLAISGARLIIEEAACPIVTDIIKSQLYSSAKCMGVSINKEVTTGFYKATATLDNGYDINITIEEKDNGMIYIRIPNQ
ncbi:DUF4339 domain-containing protein [Spartinivicinus ruber]|uniref:DUF4339 domain-containing protein n=1 Tax=Spartinivicinus ruber TaxID=2683272 RepID=UPI0013D01EB0|nr:DUF4339 domain-containing protein [Spartinivicinus ruber]